MAWWQWIVLGAVLFIGEMIIDPAFYLFFFGLSAITLGLVGLSPVSIPIWGQWLLFSAIAIAFLAFFRMRLYSIPGRSTPDLSEGVVGEFAVAKEAIAPGHLGRVELRGATWTAKNTGDEPLRPGKRARVESMSGLTVIVRPEI